MTPTPASSAWNARYGDTATLPSSVNPIVEHLLNHCSVRAYDPRRQVGDEALKLAVAAAQSASTSSNLQVWSVVAVRDQAARDRYAELAGRQQHISDAPLFLAWVLDLSRLRRIGETVGIPAGGTDYLELYTVGAVDVALAAQNAATALESLGLGIVYIGGLRNRPEDVARELGLPPGCMALFGMCVGYPDPTQPADIKPRLPQSAVLHSERYGTASEADDVHGYDARIVAYQTMQGRGDKPWSRTATTRVRGPESLNGRDRLREALVNLGIEAR
ncbi:NADPH-dependent oxidoreductase [Bordetella petrii]|nr:NADPH-dependent oxidoreductase [Bordetella petrii]